MSYVKEKLHYVANSTQILIPLSILLLYRRGTPYQTISPIHPPPVQERYPIPDHFPYPSSSYTGEVPHARPFHLFIPKYGSSTAGLPNSWPKFILHIPFSD